MKYIYVVKVNDRISQEAYYNLDDAKEFIHGRTGRYIEDDLSQVYVDNAGENTFSIHPVAVK